MEPRSDHLKDSGWPSGSRVFFMPPSLVKANNVKRRGLKQTPHFLRFPRCRLLVFVAACLLRPETTNAADDGEFFRREVAPTLERRCLRCHNEDDHKGGFMLEQIPTPPHDLAEFSRLHAAIRPRPEEQRWREIPWEVDLWEARRRAAEENKPIFMWAMNGNPLGCV